MDKRFEVFTKIYATLHYDLSRFKLEDLGFELPSDLRIETLMDRLF